MIKSLLGYIIIFLLTLIKTLEYLKTERNYMNMMYA